MLKVSLHNSPKKRPILTAIVVSVVIVLLCVLTKNVLYGFITFLLIIIGFFIHRLFFVKLRMNEGDIFIFYGLPGSGKTLMMTKVAEDNKDLEVGVNEEFAHYKNKDFVFDRSDLGKYNFGHSFLLCYDECSLNGFDARNHSSNFQDESILSFFKKIRHAHGACILTNQGREEVDLKIRDNLCNRFYYCQKHTKFFGLFTYCTATVLKAEESISEITGLPIRYYSFPSIIDRILDPTLKLYAVPFMYKNLYNTHSMEKLSVFPYLVSEDDMQ